MKVPQSEITADQALAAFSGNGESKSDKADALGKSKAPH